MKKQLTALAIFGLLAATATADIFGPSRNPEYNRSSDAVSTTVVEYSALIAEYLGPRVGIFYDLNRDECLTYVAGTVYTSGYLPLSVSIGALNDDGGAVTLDYNLGSIIPCEEVPLLSVFEYLYVGAGIGIRALDGDNNGVYGLDAQFKLTW
jgi:hypothetical protein